MDLTKALVLSALVFVLVEYAKQSLPDRWLAAKGVLAGASLVIGIAVGWATGVVGWTLIGPMLTLLAVEVISVGAFLLLQITGGVGRIGRAIEQALASERALAS